MSEVPDPQRALESPDYEPALPGRQEDNFRSKETD